MFGVNKSDASSAHFRRGAGILLAMVMAAALPAGCGGIDKGTQTDGEESSTGDYKRYDIAQIEGLQFVFSLDRTDEGLIVLGDNDEGNLYRYTSEDDGVTWSESELATGVSASDGSDGASFMAMATDVDADGNAVVGYVEIDAQANVTSCSIWSEATGDFALINTENIKGLICSADGDAVYVYDGENVGRYELTGSAVGSGGTASEADEVAGADSAGSLAYAQTYVTGTGSVLDFCEMGTELVVLTENELVRYDSKTGEKNGTDSAFVDVLGSRIQETVGNLGMESGNCRKIMRAGSDGKLYLMLDDGFYSYDTDDGLATRFAGKESGEWKDSTTVMFDFDVNMEDENAELTVICSGDNGKNIVVYSKNNISGNAAKSSENTESTENSEAHEITVYSLYYAECIEMMVNTFQTNNEGVSVNYIWGIDDESGVTVSDAVNSLNTQLLAGNGPDVIVMDGLNERSYEKSGVLLDLSDVIADIQSDEPSCLTNVLTAYKTDGGVYAIPSKLQFMAMVGSSSDIDGINSVDSLIEYIQGSDKPNYGNDLNIYEWEALFDTLYPIYAIEFTDTQGNYDEKMMKEFIAKFKELYDLEMGRTNQDEITGWIAENGEYAQTGSISAACMKSLYNREYSGQKIALVNMERVSSLWTFYSIKHDRLSGSNEDGTANQDYTYKVMEGSAGKSYIPTLVFSVNANSSETDSAKQFVKYMFSVDIQKTYYGDNAHIKQGNPVNMDAIKAQNDEMLAMGTPGGIYEVGGSEYVFSSYFTDDSDMNEYIDTLTTLAVPVNMDERVKEIIKEKMPDYVDGKSGLDDTFDAINETIQIYLSE